MTPRATLDVIASFQKTVIDELLRRAVRSAEEMDASSIIISGGVACNAGLQAAAKKRQDALSGLFSDAWPGDG